MNLIQITSAAYLYICWNISLIKTKPIKAFTDNYLKSIKKRDQIAESRQNKHTRKMQ